MTLTTRPARSLKRAVKPAAKPAVLALVIAALAASAAPALGQRAALPNAQGFQPLVIPTQSTPLVLPQPIRIPTAILPNAPVLPLAEPSQAAAQPYAASQPLQYGLPPAPIQAAPAVPGSVQGTGQQQAAFWERQGQPLRLWQPQPAPQQQVATQQIYPQFVYPQQAYPQVSYPPLVTYPQAVYQPVIYPQQADPQAIYPQVVYPQQAYPQPLAPLAQPLASPSTPSQPRQIAPIPEFASGKGALQGYKEAAQIAKAQMGNGHVLALVDLSEQRMTVSVNGKPWYDWPVSTGRKGYRTPTGTWGVQRMHREYQSRSYDNAPMPHSIFYDGPYAIHGTNAVSRLGRTASHGCVRLHPKNAAMLFTLAEVFGKDWMTVKVQN